MEPAAPSGFCSTAAWEVNRYTYRDKQFYKSFLLLCLPIVLQNVIALSVNLADNIMLGSYSEAALSGATAVNQIQFIYQNILMGIGDSMVILASQYWGKRDTAAMKKIASVAMRAGLIVMVVLFAVMSLFPAQVMDCLPVTLPSSRRE